MKTIVIYTSQTGFTQKYAKWIGERLDAELLTLADTRKKPEDYFEQADALIFGGWAMAGKVSGVKWFLDRIEKWKEKKLAIFCTGGSPNDNPEVDGFLKTALSEEQQKHAKIFFCQAGINYDKMKLPSRLAMKAFASMVRKTKKSTPEEIKMGEMLSHSYDISDKKYIEPIIEYITA